MKPARVLALAVPVLVCLSLAPPTIGKTPIIPERKLFFLSPHPDDIALTFGGLLLNEKGFPGKESFYEIFCSISNYSANFLDLQTDARVKRVTLMRTEEDLSFLMDVFGGWDKFRYRAHGEYDAPLRHFPGPIDVLGQPLGPVGDFSTFRKEEKDFFLRTYHWAKGVLLPQRDCAAFVLMANVHGIDHFVVREAVIKAAHDLGPDAECQIYFGEDQPYTGVPGEVHDLVVEQIKQLTHRLGLEPITYPIDAEAKVKIFNAHYLSQYEDYRPAIVRRAEEIGGERIYRWDMRRYGSAATEPSCTEPYCQLD